MTHIRTQIAKAKRDLKTTLAGLGNQPSRGAIKTALRQQGYKQRGQGAFAIVMVHPELPQVVVKIGQVMSGRKFLPSTLSDRFMDYCEWIKHEGTASRYALKVYHNEWVSDQSGGTYVAVIEKCKPCYGSDKAEMVTTAAWAAKHTLTGRGCKPRRSYSRAANDFLLRLGSEIGGTLDIHPANIMQRTDGSIVVTDPLC